VIRHTFTTAALLAVLCIAAPANADTLLTETSLLQGQQSLGYSLKVNGPGTITVSLSDMNWQGRLEDLSFAMAGSTGLVNPALTAAAAGSALTFTVGEAGTYFACVSGRATGRYGLGLFSLVVTFAASTPAVPLPPGIWSLLGGLAGLAALRRKNFVTSGA
jgi:hypothetical protein